MKTTKVAVAVFVLIFLQGCEQPDRYPVSGEACGPNDPVKELTVEDCAPSA